MVDNNGTNEISWNGAPKKLEAPDLKLILLGDSAVGKSKLVERFLLDNYEERTSSTHALTMYRKKVHVNDEDYNIDIWDTAGQECYMTLHPSYYFGAHSCILTFDATRKITYQNLHKWYSEMRSHCPNIPCILVANKIDIDERVTKRKYKFSEDHNLGFFFVSAATGVNVVKIFEIALRNAIEYKKNPPDRFFNDVMDLLNEDGWYEDEEKTKA